MLRTGSKSAIDGCLDELVSCPMLSIAQKTTEYLSASASRIPLHFVNSDAMKTHPYSFTDKKSFHGLRGWGRNCFV